MSRHWNRTACLVTSSVQGGPTLRWHRQLPAGGAVATGGVGSAYVCTNRMLRALSCPLHPGGSWGLLRDCPLNDCVARVSERPQFGHLASSLREADVLRTPGFEHPVQGIDGNLDLGRSTLIGAQSKTITDDPFEAADVGLHPRSPGVTSRLLPNHASALCDGLEMPISLQPRAIDQQMHGIGARPRANHVQALGPATERCVVWHG